MEGVNAVLPEELTGPAIAPSAGMQDDDLFVQVLNPRHIPGIYSYCDRWCARCPFAERCLVNSTARAMLEAGERPVADGLTAHLRARFDVARRAIEARPDDGRDPWDVECEDGRPAKTLEERRNERRHHPLIREARAYAGLVDAWFDAEESALRAHADALAERAATDPLEVLPEPDDMTLILDAVDIVRWDRSLVESKLARAMLSPSADILGDGMQHEANGSAKVALVALDRSEASWRLLDNWLPLSGSARIVAVQARALREAIEAFFPDARRFLRPGFDGVFPAG